MILGLLNESETRDDNKHCAKCPSLTNSVNAIISGLPKFSDQTEKV